LPADVLPSTSFAVLVSIAVLVAKKQKPWYASYFGGLTSAQRRGDGQWSKRTGRVGVSGGDTRWNFFRGIECNPLKSLDPKK
jgi:hypothetical protein